MGGGSYSYANSEARTSIRKTMRREEIFTQRKISPDMDPKNLTFREARDSEEHPVSFPIIIGLDVTGSMGDVPDAIVRHILSKVVRKVEDANIKDPQILFLGIGDHKTDHGALQVGQFESSDELMDKWLTSVWLEGGGGANGGESYLLAWYLAAYHTQLDHFQKRGKKGFLFTIGDENVHSTVHSTDMTRIMGGEANTEVSYNAKDLYEAASKMYHVFHIHTRETSQGRYTDLDNWKNLIGEHLLYIDDTSEILDVITNAIIGMNDNQYAAVDIQDAEEAKDDANETVMM